MTYQFNQNEIILLLGAGASQEANIPITREMIIKIENLLQTDWKDYAPLYNYILSQYRLLNNNNSSPNIEDLVGILDELLLLLKKEHPLALFHLSWINFIENVGNYTVDTVMKFKQEIVKELKKWVELENTTNAKYYRNIARFQKSYNYPFRIFTLNYDKCIEETCKTFTETGGEEIKCSIERGFGNEENDYNTWAWERFKQRDTNVEENEPDIYLYKMHGSIDWTRNEQKKIIHKSSNTIKEGEHLIIFGTKEKVKAYDPFLFFIYEFREYTLSAKVICICGYGFWDNHINEIMQQALETDETKILVVNKYKDKQKSEENQKIDDEAFVRKQLNLSTNNKIIIEINKASEFFEQQINLDYLNQFFETQDDLPF
jgi:SIR2-like domain